MANNNYPQVTSVTSESLQAKIRDLLPSQEGFGTDLMAQNVIVPIIDLTAAAQGTDVPSYLQTALAFGSQTTFSVNNASSTIASVPGFYRVFGCAVAQNVQTGAANAAFFTLTDGLSSKTIWNLTCDSTQTSNSSAALSELYDFTVFLAAGESLTAQSSDSQAFNKGSIRQIADVNGVLVYPSGFTPQ